MGVATETFPLTGLLVLATVVVAVVTVAGGARAETVV